MPDALSLFSAPFFSLTAARVTPLYAAALLLLTLHWWRRVAREGRGGRVPRVGWWGMPGLLFLLFTPILEQPTFFAVGAFLLLVAEYWPAAYRRAARRIEWWWPALGALLGGALLVSVVQSSQAQRPALAAGLALLLSGVAGLVSALSWPGEVRSRPATLPGWPRWMNVTVPEWPDLSLTLSAGGAELRNVSTWPLKLSGWSPARINGWLALRDLQGEPLRTLEVGEAAWLPLGQHASGVRVWYEIGEGNGAAQARLFRADWTPTVQGQERVLN